MSFFCRFLSFVYVTFTVSWLGAPCRAESYPIVDTGQERCYDNLL